MHVNNGLPVFRGDAQDGTIAKDAGVINDNIDFA